MILFNSNIDQPKDKHIVIGDILDDKCIEPVKTYFEDTARHTKNYVQWDNSGKGHNSQQNRAWYPESKLGTLPHMRAHGKVALLLDVNTYRRFNQLEFERLQTIPEGYTSCLPKTYACGVIGNGWTTDVIVHLFKGMKIDII